MLYFIDTEFEEGANGGIDSPTGGGIDLISIGIVAEDGTEFYAEDSQYRWSQCGNPWLIDNVKPHLQGGRALMDRGQLKDELEAFFDDEPVLIGYYNAFDYVIWCWIFGRMIDMPSQFQWWHYDIKQWAKTFQIPRDALPADPEDEHNALADARWVQDAYNVVFERASRLCIDLSHAMLMGK